MDIDWDGRVSSFENQTLKLRLQPEDANMKGGSLFH